MPHVEVERIFCEFLALEQTKEITDRFKEMALFCPQYATTEDMKMTRYFDMLWMDIREFVARKSVRLLLR